MWVSEKPLRQMSDREIEDAVQHKFDEVACDPAASFNFPIGKQFALDVGYPKDVLDALPPSMVESFAGAHNPQPFVELNAGEIVLDLGCGAGLDLYFYAHAVGSVGKVYGVDISDAMVQKATTNMRALGLTNVEVTVGRSTAIPLPDGSIDIVATNGIYNLTPDKDAVMREVFRVLRPGGRTVLCEIVLTNPLPESIKTINDWFRCIGGALLKEDFVSLMAQAGFERIDILSTVRNARTGHELSLCVNIRAYKPEKYPSAGSTPSS